MTLSRSTTTWSPKILPLLPFDIYIFGISFLEFLSFILALAFNIQSTGVNWSLVYSSLTDWKGKQNLVFYLSSANTEKPKEWFY